MMLTELEITALALSLKVAFVASICILPIGIALAWLLAKKEFYGKSLLDGLIHLPLVLPPVVIGYVLLILFGKQGPLGKWLEQYLGLDFSFSWRGAALASAVVALPLMVRAIRLSILSVDSKLEDAAMTLGANPWRVFQRVTLPLIMPGVISGFVLAFARSLGEFGATITFVSNIPGETQTIPLAMFSFLETPGAEFEAMRLCILAIVIALVSLFISEWMSRRSQQKLGLV
ncbi:molybdate ABC transporter permease subunit [Vibrio breoganii]|uniref:molybdate ABC transporter permease subunit n=1 Tax=Vibrio breoganii TaxID=553239 RepID=UPI000474E830|nr:molybdate ABC transporter permease subunit [Vibrio breoganii]MDN3716073.1 molybdate ABC transporter permease subunit [Vibrio breoganii]OCH72756.1 molybdate ABC transporter permease [Vibrio breoganii]OEF88225.1 molybdate ABC transporter permease [Vibrio breoganii 1C10]PMG08731.1 molybdate ABC transporter permease [Vibrio breoganii]PMG86076.1 molybdate ABC transporter permease [Vibrio breoganii]